MGVLISDQVAIAQLQQSATGCRVGPVEAPPFCAVLVWDKVLLSGTKQSAETGLTLRANAAVDVTKQSAETGPTPASKPGNGGHWATASLRGRNFEEMPA